MLKFECLAPTSTANDKENYLHKSAIALKMWFLALKTTLLRTTSANYLQASIWYCVHVTIADINQTYWFINWSIDFFFTKWLNDYKPMRIRWRRYSLNVICGASQRVNRNSTANVNIEKTIAKNVIHSLAVDVTCSLKPCNKSWNYMKLLQNQCTILYGNQCKLELVTKYLVNLVFK